MSGGRTESLSRAIIDVLNERVHSTGTRQVDLSVRTGISQSQISRVLRHQVKPSLDATIALCDALGITFADAVADAVARLR